MSRDIVPEQPLRLAVITGAHPFDVIAFHSLFRNLQGIDAYIQHIDAFTVSSQEIRDSYDVVLFYTFIMETPHDDNIPWYMGTPRAALEHLGETNQGIVVLHHGILAYQEWPFWNQVVGIPNRNWTNHVDQVLNLHIANPDHPVTQGLQDWTLEDETYTMDSASGDCIPLVTVEHPVSMKTIAWAHQFKESRVFGFQSGHDDAAFSNPGYRSLLERGIKWAGRRI
jgi:uncharacterized protein